MGQSDTGYYALRGKCYTPVKASRDAGGHGSGNPLRRACGRPGYLFDRLRSALGFQSWDQLEGVLPLDGAQFGVGEASVFP
jgi:hypothetical protein